ncbi:MAG: protein kinase [Acidobacteria bacterium]|nr:protein kinase [Acidobacteriota bacterium]
MKCPSCLAENPDDSQYCAKCSFRLSKTDDSSSSATQTLKSAILKLETGSAFADRYQIIEELGRGGMGRVYKALDMELNEKIALKLLKPQIAADEDMIERFRNELTTARNVTHKNICRMYDLGKYKGNYYITMEYVPGEDLKSMLSMIGVLGPGKTVSIGIQICQGLLEAHKHGVVHRDLKPQNIMIDREGAIRIMDFGIARSLKSKGITGVGTMIGTPEYMSPEQAEGKEVDRRSDIYSLGIVLYEMATGQLPFKGETHLSIAMKHKGEIPKNPQEINPRIDDNLNLLILKCLEKEKDNRYSNVVELLEELKRINKELPVTKTLVSQRKTTTSKQITVTLGPKKLLVPILAAAVIILAFLAWKLLAPKNILPIAIDKPSLAIVYFENGTGDKGNDHWRRGLASLLISDLQQSKYIDVLSSDRLFGILRDMDLLESASYATGDLNKLAALGRNSHILQGIFTKAGDTYRINVTIQKAATGELIGSEEVEGRGIESFYSMVDELTKRIKTHFQIPQKLLVSDIDREIQNITTSSPEAYQLYIEGRRLFYNGEYAESIAVMEKAIEIDPEFAMAYRSISISFGNRGLLNRRREYLKKAISYKSKLSAREQHIIQGDIYFNSEKTYAEAIRSYKLVLKDYPDDTISLHNTAVLYQDLEDWDNAFKYYATSIAFESGFIPTYTQYAELLINQDRITEARDVLNGYLAIWPEHPDIRLLLAFSYLAEGRYPSAQKELDKAAALFPDNFHVPVNQAMLFHYLGRLAEAEEEYGKLMNHSEPEAQYYAANGAIDIDLRRGRFSQAEQTCGFAVNMAFRVGVKWAESEWRAQLAYIHLRKRHPQQALKEAELALAAADEVGNFNKKRTALLFKGLSFLEMGHLDEAQAAANELKSFIEEGINPKKIRLFHFLQGRIEMAKGNGTGAVEHLEKAVQNRDFGGFYPAFYTIENQHLWHLYSLASSYFQIQDYARALVICDEALGLNFHKIGYGDVLSKCYYLKGQIFQKLGQTQNAAASYEKFLELWENADAGLHEITDAQSQLAILR